MFHLKAHLYGINNTQNLSVLGKKFIFNKYLPNNRELAKLKCREYLESNINCLLVEFSDRFALYLDAEINSSQKPTVKGETHLILTV